MVTKLSRLQKQSCIEVFIRQDAQGHAHNRNPVYFENLSVSSVERKFDGNSGRSVVGVWLHLQWVDTTCHHSSGGKPTCSCWYWWNPLQGRDMNTSQMNQACTGLQYLGGIMPIDVYTSFNQTNKMTVVHIDPHTQMHTGLLLTVHVTLLLLWTPMLSSVQLQTIQFGVA